MPKTHWAAVYPVAWSIPPTRTWPVMAWVTPELTPRSTNIVARVTMKLGRRVQVTNSPLSRPMDTANTSTMARAGQKPIPASEISRPSSSPVDPVITPLDRSTSPLIMSRATAQAMIP